MAIGKKKTVLLVIGGLWHPFEKCAENLRWMLEDTGRFAVAITKDRDMLKPGVIREFDCVAVYAQGGKLSKAQEKGLVAFVREGGAFVGIHSATAAWHENADYIDMIGGRFDTHGPVLDFPVRIVDPSHAITSRVADFRVTDELYLLDKFDAASVHLLATAHYKGKEHPVAYTKAHGKGRVYYLALGHDERAFMHPTVRQLLLRGFDWAVGRPLPKPLKAGVIGYGGSFNMGKLHLDSMRDAGGFEPAAVCDSDAARCDSAKQDYPGIQTYTSPNKMLKHSEIDLVTIITPHDTHAKLAIQCLEAQRHVVTEKPFCLTVKEADAMIRAAGKQKRMLSVFHNRRWDGDYLALKDLIGRGMIGEVFHVEATMSTYAHPGYWWRSHKRISGGAFYDWGAHIVDWVLGLVPSELKEVSGHFQDKRVWHDVTNEDHCSAVLRFANGCSAFIELSHIAAAGKRRWRILGTQGAIRDNGDGQFEVVTHREGLRLESKAAYRESDWHAYYRNVGDHLYFGEPLAVTPESARRVIGVIETAEASSREGKALRPAKGCA